MSIDHLKKQAKNLKKSLPDFLKEHPDGSAPLAQFQELIAKASGYPSWHAAVTAKADVQPTASAAGPGSAVHVRVVQERTTVFEYTSQGRDKPPRDFDCLTFRAIDQKLLTLVTDSLDKFLDKVGTSDQYGNEGPPPEHSHEVAALCRQLIKQDPSYIDGYAHLGNALFWLDEHAETIRVCQPFFDQLCALVPKGFKGRIAYNQLDNRPFFRLAHTMVLAYYGLKTEDGDKRAQRLAKQMLKWWPNDNIGFRFLLTPAEEE